MTRPAIEFVDAATAETANAVVCMRVSDAKFVVRNSRQDWCVACSELILGCAIIADVAAEAVRSVRGRHDGTKAMSRRYAEGTDVPYNLTPYRREVLTRLAQRGPLTLDEARDGHPNIMGTLIRAGWAVSFFASDEVFVGYQITPAGRLALGMTP